MQWRYTTDWQARAGVRIDWLAIGEATSRSEVTWNAFIRPVLNLFQQMVQPALPAEMREAVTAGFADEVNQVHGGLVSD